MRRYLKYSRHLVAATAVAAALVIPATAGSAAAQGQGSAGIVPVLRAADPAERGDGTVGSAAAAALRYGPLPASPADRRLKLPRMTPIGKRRRPEH